MQISELRISRCLVLQLPATAQCSSRCTARLSQQLCMCAYVYKATPLIGLSQAHNAWQLYMTLTPLFHKGVCKCTTQPVHNTLRSYAS